MTNLYMLALHLPETFSSSSTVTVTKTAHQHWGWPASLVSENVNQLSTNGMSKIFLMSPITHPFSRHLAQFV
jgi:hypothetical protein